MDVTYGRAIGYAVPFFLGLIAIEFVVDRKRGAGSYHLADAINSLSCGIVSVGVRVFFGFIGLLAYEWVSAHAAPVHLSGRHWGTWASAFLAYDLCYYWHHRLGHTVGLFWAAHVVHHQSEEFNLTTALRQPGTGPFSGWVFYLPLAFCGVPLGVYLVVGVIELFYQFWPHTQQIGRLGFLDRWIQTPSNHRVHHAQNDRYLDKNYVGVFLFWDRLFGTFEEERDDDPCIYGIRGQLKSWNPVWANLHYYWAMVQDSWHARSWKDKLRVWCAGPGWRPADVSLRFPKQAYDPVRDFERYDPPRSLSLSLYALVQFSVLMAANSHFLTTLPHQPLTWCLAYFAWIVAGLVTVGGVLENRREFQILEAVRLSATALAVVATGTWFGGWRTGAPAVIVLFAIASLAWLWNAVRDGSALMPLHPESCAGQPH